MAWDDIPNWALDEAKKLLDQVRQVDEHTFKHCCRVGRGSRRLAKAMGLNEFEQAVLEFSGLFHDIGKAKIPVEILTKPARLDRAEIEVMKSHPVLSAEMIAPYEHEAFFRFLLPGIRYHHEKVDGTGYPYGLKGDEIPLFARLVTIVDTFDAMTQQRVYRKALSRDKAISELLDFSGRQFDPQLVRIFVDLLPHWENESKKAEKEELVVATILRAA
jgi:putative nucleotidyltransferase with HDIG domain